MNHLIMCLVVNVVIRLFFILSRDCYFPLLFSFLWLSTLHCQHFGLVKFAAAYYTTLLYSLHTHTQKNNQQSRHLITQQIPFLISDFPLRKFVSNPTGGKTAAAQKDILSIPTVHTFACLEREMQREKKFFLFCFFLKEIVSRPNR